MSYKSKITILGSCRQDSLYKNYDITSVKNELSYPHYTKEIIQVIKYCLYDNLKSDETMIFRTPILTNNPYKKNIFMHEIQKSDIIIIEIASKNTINIMTCMYIISCMMIINIILIIKHK